MAMYGINFGQPSVEKLAGHGFKEEIRVPDTETVRTFRARLVGIATTPDEKDEMQSAATRPGRKIVVMTREHRLHGQLWALYAY